MKRQFTASVLIVKEERILLVFHKKYQKWIQPGGHMHADETPPEAALREAFEETGLHVEFIEKENMWIDYPHAISIARPYACLLENIPAYKEEPPHQHIDLIFLTQPIVGQEIHEEKNPEVRWFSLEELESLESEKEIFPEIKTFLLSVLQLPSASNN